MTLRTQGFGPVVAFLHLSMPRFVAVTLFCRYTSSRTPTGPLPKGTPSLGGFFFAPTASRSLTRGAG